MTAQDSTTSVIESIEIGVKPEIAYAAISDVTRAVIWSPELAGARPTSNGSLSVGAKFGGSNKRGIRRWRTVNTVVRAKGPTSFAFDTSFAGMPVARWSYQIDTTEAGCRVTETWTDHRVGKTGYLMKGLGLLASGVKDRAVHNRESMAQTLANMKRDLERT